MSKIEEILVRKVENTYGCTLEELEEIVRLAGMEVRDFANVEQNDHFLCPRLLTVAQAIEEHQWTRERLILQPKARRVMRLEETLETRRAKPGEYGVGSERSMPQHFITGSVGPVTIWKAFELIPTYQSVVNER